MRDIEARREISDIKNKLQDLDWAINGLREWDTGNRQFSIQGLKKQVREVKQVVEAILVHFKLVGMRNEVILVKKNNQKDKR